MAAPILLIDIATDDASSTPAPPARTAAAWVPAAYLAGGVAAPTGFAVAAQVNNVAMAWTPAPDTLISVIQRAPNVSGSPGTYAEIWRGSEASQTLPATADTAYWYRVATIANGVCSAFATPVKATAYHVDHVLAPADKPQWIAQYAAINTDLPIVSATADTLSITTEKTAYVNAVNALTSYLATLTTPTLWSDTSGYTQL